MCVYGEEVRVNISFSAYANAFENYTSTKTERENRHIKKHKKIKRKDGKHECRKETERERDLAIQSKSESGQSAENSSVEQSLTCKLLMNIHTHSIIYIITGP